MHVDSVKIATHIAVGETEFLDLMNSNKLSKSLIAHYCSYCRDKTGFGKGVVSR